MTTNQTLRAVFALVITYYMWRMSPGLSGADWWSITATAIAYVIFVSVMTYVFLMTRGKSTKYPSAVKTRLQNGFRRGQQSARNGQHAKQEG